MKVLVTGNGLLGSAIKKVSSTYKDYQFMFADRRFWDLTQKKRTTIMMSAFKPEIVIHTAARCGGVGLNQNFQEDLFYENTVMTANVIHAAAKIGVKRFIGFGSICSFSPDLKEFTEKDVQFGEPFYNNFGYAYAKRMVEVQLRAAKDQYKMEYSYFVSSNLYGENDYFNLKYAHVIPMLIHKCYLAKKNNEPLRILGDGSPTRECTFSEDLGRIVMDSLGKECGVVMVSSGQEVSVRQMVEIIIKGMEFKGPVIWDKEKVEQVKRPRVVSKLDFKFTKFDDGIKKTVKWFCGNYESIRI